MTSPPPPKRPRRLAAQQIGAATPDQSIPDLPVVTVTAIKAGGSTDGITLATVNYLGAAVPAIYHPALYSPTVGDRVAVIKCGGLLTILGARLGGFPPTT